MTTVVNIGDFRGGFGPKATLVLVGLHQLAEAGRGDADMVAVNNAVVNCGRALDNARALHLPVAFVRNVAPPAGLGESVTFPRWMPGFEPKRADMVFDSPLPSCYSNDEFGEMANAVGGNCAIAGLFGESSCLATMVDGFHRHHRLTFLADASASRGYNGLDGAVIHDAISTILAQYGKVITTQQWMRLTMRKPVAAL